MGGQASKEKSAQPSASCVFYRAQSSPSSQPHQNGSPFLKRSQLEKYSRLNQGSLPPSFSDQVLECEMELEKDEVGLEVISKLTDLYLQAMSFYEAQGNHKYKYFAKKLQALMLKPKVEEAMLKRILSGSLNEVNDKEYRLVRIQSRLSQVNTEKEAYTLVKTHENREKEIKKVYENDLSSQKDSIKRKLAERKARSQSRAQSICPISNDTSSRTDETQQDFEKEIEVLVRIDKLIHVMESEETRNSRFLSETVKEDFAGSQRDRESLTKISSEPVKGAKGHYLKGRRYSVPIEKGISYQETSFKTYSNGIFGGKKKNSKDKKLRNSVIKGQEYPLLLEPEQVVCEKDLKVEEVKIEEFPKEEVHQSPNRIDEQSFNRDDIHQEPIQVCEQNSNKEVYNGVGELAENAQEKEVIVEKVIIDKREITENIECEVGGDNDALVHLSEQFENFFAEDDYRGRSIEDISMGVRGERSETENSEDEKQKEMKKIEEEHQRLLADFISKQAKEREELARRINEKYENKKRCMEEEIDEEEKTGMMWQKALSKIAKDRENELQKTLDQIDQEHAEKLAKYKAELQQKIL